MSKGVPMKGRSQTRPGSSRVSHRTSRRSRQKAKTRPSTRARPTKPGDRSTQPELFTQGITRLMVREHARRLYRDKLSHGDTLSLQDWVLAEKDLLATMDSDDVTVV